tara:strand:- start:12142 stop:12768 length:627 start_codon:yes stop_codon:yes gene_type:complete
MSSKPKQQDYQASEAEKTQASVAKAEKDYFNQTYAPLLREMRDKASSEDLGSVARGVAGADTMQALTGRPTLSGARSVDESADLASAAVGQMAAASAQGLAAQRQQQTGVLGTARGQAGEAMSGLAQASRIQNTKDLQAAKAKQQVREAQTAAAVKVGTTLGKQGFANLQNDTSFFGGETKLRDDTGNLTGETKKNTWSDRFKMGTYG